MFIILFKKCQIKRGTRKSSSMNFSLLQGVSLRRYRTASKTNSNAASGDLNRPMANSFAANRNSLTALSVWSSSTNRAALRAAFSASAWKSGDSNVVEAHLTSELVIFTSCGQMKIPRDCFSFSCGRERTRLMLPIG